jgi:galacturan 1,4-alpha-galacturonidase
METVQLKIAYLGGGSRLWARVLMRDLANCSDLGGEIRLFDIDFPSAQLNERLGNWLQEQPGVVSIWRYQAVETIEQALRGVNLVILSIQPGSFEQMEREIEISARYGLFFPVGDTTGVPGLMRGLRSTITYSGFAQAIAAHCPKAWVINYSNPMTICTRTLTRVAPDLKVFGCCHEVFGTQHILAGLAKDALGLESLPSRDEIRVNVMGINHFTWIDRAFYRENDLLALLREHIQKPGVLHWYTREEVEAQKNWFFDARQIKFSFFQRFGILPAAGDRHLSEFVPGFTRSPEELFRWGVIRTPVSWRIENWNVAHQLAVDYLEGRRKFEVQASGEEAVRQIKALVGLGDLITNVNSANVGQAPDLPLKAVVETNAYFSRDKVEPLVAGSMPAGVRALVLPHILSQEMIVEAALTADKDLAFEAIFSNPTTNLTIDRAWEMFNEIGLPENWGQAI